jgi:glycosyltransferase involved in cell wall biosynthesis
MSEGRAALYIDMAYVLSELETRQHYSFYEARHVGGYFDRVWGVHPLADRILPNRPKKIEYIPFSDRQTVIEGSAELHNWPKALLPLNFVLSQRKLVKELAALVKRENIRIIVASDPVYTGLLGLWIKNRTGVPLAIHVGGHHDDLYEATGALVYPKLVPNKKLEDMIVHHVFTRSDLVTPGTKTIAEYALKHGAPADRMEIFPVARNMPEYHLVPPDQRPDPSPTFGRWGIPETGGPYLISVARLAPVKLVDHAIRAMAMVIEKHPNAIGIVAGEGPLRPELEALAQSLGVKDNIRFLGLVDHESLSILNPHCITVSPLTGMAMFECAMAGSPMVAYEYDELISTIVEDGRSGYIVPLRDWEAMGRRLLELVENDPLRRSMAHEIREIALNYTPERLFKHEADTYDRLLNPDRPDAFGRDAA